MRELILSAVLLATCILGCQRASNGTGDTRSALHENAVPKRESHINLEGVVGKSIGTAVEEIPLVLENEFVIEDSPGVARGVTGIGPSGEQVWLYLAKEDLRSREGAEWTLDQLRGLKVAGIAVRDVNGPKTAGEINISHHLSDVLSKP
jgi:hypothetical protein